MRHTKSIWISYIAQLRGNKTLANWQQLRADYKFSIWKQIQNTLTTLDLRRHCSLRFDSYIHIFPSTWRCFLLVCCVGKQACRCSSELLLPAVGSGELGRTHRGANRVPTLPAAQKTHLTRHTAGERFRSRVFCTLGLLVLVILRHVLLFFQSENSRCSFDATVLYKRITQVLCLSYFWKITDLTSEEHGEHGVFWSSSVVF